MNETELFDRLRDVERPGAHVLDRVAARIDRLVMEEPRRTRRRRRWTATTAVVVAGALAISAVVLHTASHPATDKHPVASGHPAPLSLRDAILAAFSNVNTDIVYTDSTETSSWKIQGVDTFRTEVWASPAQPEVGQIQTRREIDYYGSQKAQDIEMTFTTPAADAPPPSGCNESSTPGANFGLGALTAGMQIVRGTLIDVTYAQGFYEDRTDSCFADVLQPADPQAIDKAIADGNWVQTGRGEIDGHAAIELTILKDNLGPTASPDILWIDSTTHLPLEREATYHVTGTAGSPQAGQHLTDTSVTTYSFLPDTAATKAKLTTPIPSKFPRHPYTPPSARP